MERPQLYNVIISNYDRSEQLIAAALSAYNIHDEDRDAFVINLKGHNGKRAVIACLPLDIAKTFSDIFLDSCEKQNLAAGIDLQLSGKYGE